MVNDMDYKSTVRKHGIIICICVICRILVIAGSSYALFFQNSINTTNQVLKTGKLEVSFGENSSRITLNPILPVSNEVGLTNDTYASSVKIDNTGSLPASYELKLSKDIESGQTFVDLQYINIAVFVGDTAVFETQEHPEKFKKVSELSVSDGKYVLYDGSLDAVGTENGNPSANITVRMWLDQSTPATEEGKYLNFSLVVDSIVDESKTEEGQATNNS